MNQQQIVRRSVKGPSVIQINFQILHARFSREFPLVKLRTKIYINVTVFNYVYVSSCSQYAFIPSTAYLWVMQWNNEMVLHGTKILFGLVTSLRRVLTKESH